MTTSYERIDGNENGRVCVGVSSLYPVNSRNSCKMSPLAEKYKWRQFMKDIDPIDVMERPRKDRKDFPVFDIDYAWLDALADQYNARPRSVPGSFPSRR